MSDDSSESGSGSGSGSGSESDRENADSDYFGGNVKMHNREDNLDGGTNPTFMKMIAIRKLLAAATGVNGIALMSVASKLAKQFDPNKSKSESELVSEVKKYIDSNKAKVESMVKEAERSIADKRKSKKA
jgi:hypothetical protein